MIYKMQRNFSGLWPWRLAVFLSLSLSFNYEETTYTNRWVETFLMIFNSVWWMNAVENLFNYSQKILKVILKFYTS